MGVKLAVVGGGSTYTPELSRASRAALTALPIDELVLLDPDPERLEIVGGLAGRMLDRLAWPGRLTLTGDTDAAIDGASFVLVQLRVGGQAARLVDETLPRRSARSARRRPAPAASRRRFARCRSCSTWPSARGAPRRAGAWILDFTNPVGIVTQALLDDGHRAIGLCNVAIGFQRRFAARFGVEPERVELGHVGLNHLSWIRSVGRRRRPVAGDPRGAGESRPKDAGRRRRRARPAPELDPEVLPQVLLRGRRARRPAHGENPRQRGHRHRARAAHVYRDPDLDEKPKLLERRGGAFYSEAAAALIASLHDGTARPGRRRPQRLANPDRPTATLAELCASRSGREGAAPIPRRRSSPRCGASSRRRRRTRAHDRGGTQRRRHAPCAP